MKRNLNFWGLPDFGLNLFLGGLSVFMGLMGVKLLLSPNFDLQWANARIVTSNSATKLEKLTEKVGEQATIIRQKDEAYKQLELAYQEALSQGVEDSGIGEAIEAIKELPEIEGTTEIQQEILEIESDLIELNEDS